MTAVKRPVPSQPRNFEFPSFNRFRLSNGLGVVVAPMHRLPVVTAILVVDGGASCEPIGVEGVADIVAHSLSEGTTRQSADELVMALERLGTSVRANADWESSILKLTVMSPNLSAALELLGEMAIHPRFDESAVTRIRDERLSEIIQTRSEPSVLADEAFNSDLYGDQSRYGLPLGGTEHSVKSVSRRTVADYHSSVFRPDRSTLILAGDVTFEKAKEFAGQIFADWSAPTSQSDLKRDTSAHSLKPRVHVVDRPGAQQSELRMGHVAVPRSVPEYFDIVVMNAVLGGLFSSRINLNLREVHGYTYGASSYFDWRRASGPFVISTAVQSEVTGAAVSEVFKEIEKLQIGEIDASELSLATSYLAGVFPIRYETSDAVASALASLVIFDLPDDYFSAYRARVMAVTTERVLRAAQRFLQPTELSIIVAGNPDIVRPQLTTFSTGNPL